MQNQYYNYIYPLNQFPTVEININNQPLIQNQINFFYQNQNLNLINQWKNLIEQSQRNLMEFEAIKQVNAVIGQTYSQSNGLIGNAQNGSLSNLQ